MAGISSAPEKMAAGSVTEQMADLLSKAFELRSEVPDIWLGHDELNVLIQNAKTGVTKLGSVEEKEVNASKDLETWLEKVNATILMAGDVLDECRYHYLARKEPKGKARAFISSLIRRPSLSYGLKSVNSKLRNEFMFEDHCSRGISKGAPEGRSGAAQAVKDNSKLELEVVQYGVGNLVDELLIGRDLLVITIVGWNDTGKTSLAQLLYKHFDVMCYFDERMWVQVPDDFDTFTIAERMLTNLNRARVGAASDQEKGAVSLHLQNRLKGKIFLLVLVGASDIIPRKLLMLKEFLKGLGGCRGSKILITTGRDDPRIESSFMHPMKLDADQYHRKLFENIAFAEGGPNPSDKMKETGRAIVDLCGRNSLYIKLVGSLLYRLKSERQWSNILEKLEGRSSIIPQLCFDYMTSLPLKRCFQYCYFFPKGCLMRREDLIELWMALGYCNVQSLNKSVHDMAALGRKFYDVLLKSSFLQVSEDDDFDMQSCKIPDELHGLRFHLEVSGVQYFKTIVEGADARDICDGTEHLTLIRCHNAVKFSNRFSKLRSLCLDNTKGLADILGCARGLCVLIVVDAEMKDLPDSIGKLTRLRYLDISRTSIVKLPDSISKLCNLQTLRLHDSVGFPDIFKNVLKNMMHLYIHKVEDLYHMYASLSYFESGKLVYVSSAKAMLKVFVDKEGKLDSTMLHKLSNRCTTINIHCLENANRAAPAGISEWLSKIPAGTESLKLNWSARRENRIDEDVLDELKPNQGLKELTLENFKGTRFPSWMTMVDSPYVSNLVKLELENCSWCEELPPLGHLSCLRIVKIVGMDNVQSITDDFYGGAGTTSTGPVFGKLKELTLCGMSELRDWSGSTASSTSPCAFPYLERFEVDQCPKLKGIPDIVLTGEPKCLRRVKVSFCRNLGRLPKGLGELECLEDLELFGLPELEEEFSSIGDATNLKSLIIGCVSTMTAEEKVLSQLERLKCLTNLTIWGYAQENIADCFGKLRSLQVLKFESCRRLKKLPHMISSNLKELHISYCPDLEASCITGSRPEWPKVSHIKTIVVNGETIREPKAKDENSACQNNA